MKTYRIAGIELNIRHQSNSFLRNNIEHYEIPFVQHVKYTIEVDYVQHIEQPQGHSKSTKNPYTIYLDEKRIIFIKNKEGNIKTLIEHDVLYHHVSILINPDLLDNPDEMEYTWLGLMFMEIALLHGFLPIHGAAINDHGQAIIISAPSQTGKSTHAALWKDMDSSIEILNDDKPLIGLSRDQLMVYSSPFSGKTSQNQNQSLILKSLVFLYQSPHDVINTMMRDDIIKEVMKNIMRPSDEKTWTTIINIIEKMIQTIPIYHLGATPTIQAAKLLRQTLDQGESL